MSGKPSNPGRGTAGRGNRPGAGDVEARVREQIVHDLELLRDRRGKLEQHRGPMWLSLRFIGLVTVFVAAVSWYTRTDIGLTAGMVLFVVGALLIMVPRGAGFSTILRWDGGLKVSNPQLDLENLDDQIAALERALERMDEDRGEDRDNEPAA